MNPAFVPNSKLKNHFLPFLEATKSMPRAATRCFCVGVLFKSFCSPKTSKKCCFFIRFPRSFNGEWSVTTGSSTDPSIHFGWPWHQSCPTAGADLMRSEGSRFTLGVWGQSCVRQMLRLCSQLFATVCATAVRLSTVVGAPSRGLESATWRRSYIGICRESVCVYTVMTNGFQTNLQFVWD